MAIDIKEQLAALRAYARADGKWFYTLQNDMWFSPDELERENAKGCYLWEPSWWELRDPFEALNALNAKLKRVQQERDVFADRVVQWKISQRGL